MIIVWGFKTYLHLLGITTMVCHRCSNPAAHRVEKQVRKFTLFWIPLFPVRQQVVITCTFCGVSHEVPKEHQAALLEALQVTGATQPTAQPGVQPIAPAPQAVAQPQPRDDTWPGGR